MRINIVGILTSALVASLVSLSPAAAQVTLRFGHIFAAGHPIADGADMLKKLVEEKTGGSVIIEVFPAQQLGGMRQLEDATRLGLVDICSSSASTLSTIYGATAMIGMPYTFRDQSHLEKVITGEIGQKIYADMITETGTRPITTFYEQPRQLTADRKILKTEDAKGMKIRVPEVKAFLGYWQKVGTVPTPIDFGELFTSLQLGTVNAQENPVVTIASAKLQEVQKYLMMTNHVRGLNWFLMSEQSFQKLDEAQRTAVLEAGQEVSNHVNKIWADQTAATVKSLQDGGMEVVEVDEASFRAAADGLYKDVLDPKYFETYEQILAVK